MTTGSSALGTPCANQYIVNAGPDSNIGFHYDKPKSIAPGSLITIVFQRRVAEKDRRVGRNERLLLEHRFANALHAGRAKGTNH